jgi:DNA-binding HxlR family transcriptional regulator
MTATQPAGDQVARDQVAGDQVPGDQVIVPVGRLADRGSATGQGWCPIEGALERIGTRSAVILLREVFYGARRFDDLARLTGLTDAVAAKRLKQLVADGLLAQRPYREPGARTRYEYVLTERSRELFALLVAFADWGRRLDADRDGVEFVHAGCGAALQADVHCAHGHVVAPGEAEARLASDGK